MRAIVCFATLFLAVVAGSPSGRILGGELTTIDKYPYAVAVLFAEDGTTFVQHCGGTIITNRSVLTSARCFQNIAINAIRLRVGSSFASSGGSVHTLAQVINHSSYNPVSIDNDIAIARVANFFVYGANIQRTTIAGTNYILPDDTSVTTIGWGETAFEGAVSEQLREVQIATVNHDTCRSNYNVIGMAVTDNNICAGNLQEGGQDACSKDYGGPLLHNNVVIGIASFGTGCGYRGYPAVYTSVNQYTSWVQANA